jgi:hypothetical protein
MRWIKSLAGVPAPAGGAHILYSVTRYPCQPLRERIFWTTCRRLLFDFATAVDASNIGTPGSLAVVFSAEDRLRTRAVNLKSQPNDFHPLRRLSEH